MVDKKQVRLSIKQLKRIKTWQLIVLLVLAGFISATLLRLNNVGMVQRRQAVLVADENGSKEDIVSRLYELQRYVSAHMNTDMGDGIYLEHQYERDRETAIYEASVKTGSTENVYKQITDTCRAQYSVWSSYFQCVTNSLNNVPEGQDFSTTVKLPNIETYKHDFISPIWSPDFAGWSLVICVLIATVIIVRLVGLIILKIILRHRYKAI